ncbi:MAG: hypothetical protein LBO74_07620 [Candidatus Symbiothrix sp.]|jgi:hypothetical protein|nr:hypothetical protein [Candidatus Symbiothrix sp.]
MKKIFITYFLWIIFIPFTISQNVINSGLFLKRVESNLLAHTLYNSQSKGDIEKLFFGNFNAPVEFFYAPSFEDNLGFRVMRDSSDTSYIIEIKCFINYEEAAKEAKEKFHLIEIPIELWNSLPRDAFNLIFDYNSYAAIGKRYSEELHTLLKVETRSFPISDKFAKKLYDKLVSFIDNFKGKGVPSLIADGYSVTFRTVVDDEVWSLWIHQPQENALKMANLCRQIITDAETNILNESKYIELLD